jgi:hypothetical protein
MNRNSFAPMRADLTLVILTHDNLNFSLLNRSENKEAEANGEASYGQGL